jgi:hypothetical protein
MKWNHEKSHWLRALAFGMSSKEASSSWCQGNTSSAHDWAHLEQSCSNQKVSGQLSMWNEHQRTISIDDFVLARQPTALFLKWRLSIENIHLYPWSSDGWRIANSWDDFIFPLVPVQSVWFIFNYGNLFSNHIPDSLLAKLHILKIFPLWFFTSNSHYKSG